MRYIIKVLIGLTFIALAGCEQNANTGTGFSLPEGDAATGKIVFVELGCNQCHSVADIERLPTDDADIPNVVIGGSVARVKSYGDLVTSIINPSHKILGRYDPKMVKNEDGSSKMLIYNDVMTVTQLVDLVTFLEGNYELDMYYRTRYDRFGSIH